MQIRVGMGGLPQNGLDPEEINRIHNSIAVKPRITDVAAVE
jgi:hypothetical protein